MASFRPRGAAVAGRKGGGPGMDAARRRRRVGPTDDWEQLELLCLWPEQRDYELIRPLVLFGSPAAERAGETGAASERTLQRRARRFGISTLRALRLFSRTLHADQIVAVGNVQRRRLRLRPRCHAHRLSNLLGGAAFAVSLGVALARSDQLRALRLVLLRFGPWSAWAPATRRAWPRRQNQPAAVAHQLAIGQLVHLAPGLDAARGDAEPAVRRGQRTRVEAGARDEPLTPPLRQRVDLEDLDFAIDHGHVAGVTQPQPNGSGGGEVPAGWAVRRRGHQQRLAVPVEGQRHQIRRA